MEYKSRLHDTRVPFIYRSAFLHDAYYTIAKPINAGKDTLNGHYEMVGIKNDLPIVLIYGGSQGAQRINEAVIDLITSNRNKDYQIIWATGPKQYDIIKENFIKSPP